ncbi:hypothetical protein LTS15_000242 [Exophiala xenobiotica]|nr:hypothetical protein LTS15_000242 [Exophiala xenobiotica]
MYFVNLAMGLWPFKLSSSSLSPTLWLNLAMSIGMATCVTSLSGLRGSDRLSPALCNIVPALPALIVRLPSVSEVLLSEESPKGEAVAGNVMTWTDVHFPIAVGSIKPASDTAPPAEDERRPQPRNMG